MLDLSCTARDERDHYFCHLLKEIVTQKRVHAHAQDARDHTPQKKWTRRARDDSPSAAPTCRAAPLAPQRAQTRQLTWSYPRARPPSSRARSPSARLCHHIGERRDVVHEARRHASRERRATVRIEAFRLDEAAEDEPRPHPALRVERSVEVGVGARRLARLDRRAPPHRIRLVPRHPDGSGLSSSAGAECLMLRCAREAPCPRRARS